MSDDTATADEYDPEIKFHYFGASSGGGEFSISTPLLGMEPYVLLRLKPGDDSMTFDVESGGGVPATLETIEEILDSFLDIVRDARAGKGDPL